MGDSEDPIRKLLEQTGWSYEEILKKLEKYKSPAAAPEKEPSDSAASQAEADAPSDGKPTNDKAIKSNNDSVDQKGNERAEDDSKNRNPDAEESTASNREVANNHSSQERGQTSENTSINNEEDGDPISQEIKKDENGNSNWSNSESIQKECNVADIKKETIMVAVERLDTIEESARDNTVEKTEVVAAVLKNETKQKEDSERENNEQNNLKDDEIGISMCEVRDKSDEITTLTETKQKENHPSLEQDDGIDSNELQEKSNEIKTVIEKKQKESSEVENKEENNRCLEQDDEIGISMDEVLEKSDEMTKTEQKEESSIEKDEIRPNMCDVQERSDEIETVTKRKENNIVEKKKENKDILQDDEIVLTVEPEQACDETLSKSVDENINRELEEEGVKQHSESKFTSVDAQNEQNDEENDCVCVQNDDNRNDDAKDQDKQDIVSEDGKQNTDPAENSQNESAKAEEETIDAISDTDNSQAYQIVPAINKSSSEQIKEPTAAPPGASRYNLQQNSPVRLRNANSLANERLRLIRKYKNLHNSGLKRKAESNNSKAVELEDIRSKLKEQLELLRTKRKSSDSSLTLSPTKASCSGKLLKHDKSRLNSITSILLHKLKGNVPASDDASENDDDSSTSDSKVDDNNTDTRNGVVASPENILSNEGNFMIVNVIGGYKSPTPEAHYHDENDIDIGDSHSSKKHDDDTTTDMEKLDDASDETPLPESGITPTKTNDVTKIKGWKNKKFAIAKEKQKKLSERLLQMLSEDSENDTQPISMSSDNDLSATTPNSSSVENTDTGKSAFVSDALDQYLTENSQLNISYEVPKLEAEQTIKKTYIDFKFPEFRQELKRPSLLKRKDVYKPKTLAEKRKMLIESQTPEIKDFMVKMSSKQRKDYEESVLNMHQKLIEENVPFTRRCFVASTSITNTPSFVVYNGRRYRVPNSKSKEVVAEIRDRRRMYRSASTQPFKKYKAFKGYQKKPSLLNSLKTDTKMEEYNSDEWEIVHVKLPKLSLEVYPEVGRRVDPRIEHLISFDHFITQRRIDFALSALKGTNSHPKFTFPLNYVDNEDNMVMRRRLATVVNIPKEISKPVITETDSEITESVNAVVNKLLDYVEVLDIGDSILQEEIGQENEESLEVPEQTNGVPVRKRRGRKPLQGPKNVRKATLEMKRLNCQIVSISLDEENSEAKPCQKEFCKLGCICKSIECNSTNLLAGHCGLAQCMFSCSCTYKKSVGSNIPVPVGTNLFSEGIINRLQGEAKKNLAKEEKEWTQTIIKTNNQIIIVGDSKERQKRATKMPKKYDDYVEEDGIDTITIKPPTTKKAHIVEPIYENTITKPCFVKLLKHDFSDIIPFCMVHMLYKCHCRNKAVFDGGAVDTNIIGCKVLQPLVPPAPKPCPVKNMIRFRSDKTFNKELHSSRTRGLSTSYYLIRNKSLSHKNKLIKSSKKWQVSLETYLHDNAEKIMKDAGDAPLEIVRRPEQLPKDPPPNNAKRKRKQSLVELEDTESNSLKGDLSEIEVSHLPRKKETRREPKLQRRKIRLNTKQTGQEFINLTKNLESPPDHELTSNTDMGKKEFLKLLKNKKSAKLQLLPWCTLAARYENGSFQLWYTNHSLAPQLIITENGKRPSTTHYNIKLFEQLSDESAIQNDLIRWLIGKKVPFGKTSDQILLILAFHKKYWKICGICEKNVLNASRASSSSISISLIDAYGSVEDCADEPQPVPDPEVTNEQENSVEIHSDDAQAQEENIETLIHENLQESKKVMYCSRQQFQPKKLISDGGHDDILKMRPVLWAPIPSVTMACKWRVICMNLGFAFLSLSRSSYTIKYDDIMKAIKLAQAEKITMVLQSDELQKNYPHRNFGIYCVHNYADKIFIGPYFLNENHDLDTLSFVNSVLVNTNLFNQIKGKTVPGSGFWFHQVTSSEDNSIVDDDVAIIQESPALIDLTCDSDEESSDSTRNSASKSSGNSSSPKAMTLLESMLKPSQSYREENTLKAEMALDALLRMGQLNVNKTTVPSSVVSLKNLNFPDSSRLKTSKTNNTKSLIKDATSASSDSDGDDDNLMICDGSEMNQQFSEAIVNKNKEQVKCRYLLTNVPNLGYILAYEYENYMDVICPITQKTKRFPDPKAAVLAVERVLSKRFILVPPTFKFECKVVERVADDIEPLDRAVLNGYHIVGTFGVKNIVSSTVAELKAFGLDKTEIGQALMQREQKLLLPPISELSKLLKLPLAEVPLSECLSNILEGTLREMDVLHKDKVFFTGKKINLESRKTLLAEKCSKLMADLPPEQRAIAQHELDQILNVSTRSESSLHDSPSEHTPLKEKGKSAQQSDAEIVDLLEDSDDSLSNADQFQIGSPPLLAVPASKIKLTRKPLGNSLMAKKIIAKPNPRSLLSGKTAGNKFVVVTLKGITPGNSLVNASNVNLSKCTTLKLSQIKEKVLVKDLPIMVRKDVMDTINSNILQQKAKALVNATLVDTTKAQPANDVNSLKSSGSLLTTSTNSVIVPSTVASNVSSVNPLSLSKQQLVDVMSSSRLPFKCVTVARPPTKPNGDRTNNSIATLTPVPKNIATSAITKTTPNYIAIKEGNNMKYFQILPLKKLPAPTPVKRPSGTLLPQPPPKRATPGNSLLTNQIDKTEL